MWDKQWFVPHFLAVKKIVWWVEGYDLKKKVDGKGFFYKKVINFAL